VVRTFIIDQLKRFDSSPEQISGRLKLELGSGISHESIYQYLLGDREAGGELYLHPRHKHKKYQKRYGSTEKRGQITGRVSIDDRPAIVEEKSRIGDFEGDLIIGKNHKGVLATLVDRHPKFSLITKIPNKSANNVTGACGYAHAI
jgi:IS30 family transposase